MSDEVKIRGFFPGKDDESRKKYYRKIANLEEDAEITEDNIREVPLKYTAVMCSVDFDEMKDILLGRNQE